MKKYELAAEYYEKSIQILSKHYPPNHMNLIRMHLNCAAAYYCATATPSNNFLSELHFHLATSSAKNIVVENRTKKKKDFLYSLFNVSTMSLQNHSLPMLNQMHIMPNNGFNLMERISDYKEIYHPHGDANIYITECIKRVYEEIDKGDNKS